MSGNSSSAKLWLACAVLGLGCCLVAPAFAVAQEKRPAKELPAAEKEQVPESSSPVQEQTPGKGQVENETDGDSRLDALEKRVEHLERLLFSTAQLSAYDAERRLREAKERLEQSRRLFLRGSVLRNQVSYDEFVFRRAEMELMLANAREGQFHITARIDLLQAEFDLESAQRQLQMSRERLTRGYVTAERIRREETAVARATRAADTTRKKLQAIEANQAEQKKTAEQTKSPSKTPAKAPTKAPAKQPISGDK